MKTFITTIILFAFTTMTSTSYTVEVNRTDGGANGYDKINETHINEKSSLSCYDPGVTGCAWHTEPQDVWDLQTGQGTDIPWDDLETYALDEIDLGNLTGSHTANITLDGELWYRSVSWDATGSYDNVITININPSSTN